VTNTLSTWARGLIVAVLASSALVALALSPGSSSLNDPIFPWMGNGGYDAQDYNIKLRFTPDKRGVAGGVTTMEAVATQDLSQFNLDFGVMDVQSVTVNGSSARFNHEDPELTILPAQSIPNGERFRVTVTYSGTPGSVENPNPFGGQFWFVRNGTLTVLSQPSGMFMWSPVNEHPSDKATFTLALTAPHTDTAAATGVLTGTTDNADGSRTTTFRLATPTTTYVVMFAVGQYTLEEQGKVGDVRVRHYLSPATTPTMRQAVLETPNIIRYFNERLTPYPFPEVGVLTTDNNLGFALETQTLVTMPASFGNSGLPYTTMVVAHELAHLWFSSLVTYKTNKDIWVHEGFAQYLGELYATERFRGQYSLEDNLRRAYPSIVNGRRVTSLGRGNLVNLLKNSFGDAPLTPDSTARLLELIFKNTMPEAVRAGVLAARPANVNAFADLIAGLAFDTVIVSNRVSDELGALLRGTSSPVQNRDVLTPPGALKAGDDLFNQGVYVRGAMALYALRARVGDEAFWALLRAYLERYKFANASNEDFIALTAERLGADTGAFLARWVLDEQTPDLPELGLRAADYRLGAVFR
jgi:aminopeptidase N